MVYFLCMYICQFQSLSVRSGVLFFVDAELAYYIKDYAEPAIWNSWINIYTFYLLSTYKISYVPRTVKARYFRYCGVNNGVMYFAKDIKNMRLKLQENFQNIGSTHITPKRTNYLLRKQFSLQPYIHTSTGNIYTWLWNVYAAYRFSSKTLCTIYMYT